MFMLILASNCLLGCVFKVYGSKAKMSKIETLEQFTYHPGLLLSSLEKRTIAALLTLCFHNFEGIRLSLNYCFNELK